MNKQHFPAMRAYTEAVLAIAIAATLTATGCQQDVRPGKPAVDVQARVDALIYPTLRGTIGQYAVLGADARPLMVEGYGVVAYLPHTGSGDADPRIRDMLVNRLIIDGVGLYTTGTQDISPEQIMASNDISVVEVRGIIPPLARKGTVFDLYVNALPDSGTTSLKGGLLWTSDLKIRGLTLNGDDSQTIAMGRGPVFIPAPLEAEVRGKPDDVKKALRSGRIIAGGVVAEDRAIRLTLRQKNPAITRLIERVINARFPNERDKVADATDEIINIKIPREYADHPMDLVDQIMHLYLKPNEPGFIEQQAADIVEALKKPDSPHRDLGMALAGLGRSILPDYIQPNYTSTNMELRFWAARAGALMQDVGGMIVLQELICDPGSPYRRQAILALIEASRGSDTERATVALADLLRSVNTDDRILAYHALLSIRSRAITTFSVGKKFVIDIVPADSPPLIYILESESPRIAFIGRPAALPVGATFVSHDNLLTVRVDDANEMRVKASTKVDPDEARTLQGLVPDSKDNTTVTLFYRSPLGDKEATLRTVQGVPFLVARAAWVPDATERNPLPYIGASYQRIAETLAQMVAEKVIDASIVVEHTPDQIVDPTDRVLSGRTEGSTQAGPQPATPATEPASDATLPGALDALPPIPDAGLSKDLPALPSMPSP